MPVHHLPDMTWEEVRALDRTHAVALLPVGAVEAHGPHLPVSTDVIIAGAMAREGARLLAAEGVSSVILPPVWYTAAGFSEDFPGTVGVAAATVTALLCDIARALARQGFTTLAVANVHLDPAHLESLRSAGERMPDAVRWVCPDLTRRRVAERLTEEFRTGACHAGRFEGSVVLAERPELVRTEVAATLPPNPASLSRAIRAGMRTFEDAGGARAYFGWPAEASAEEGRATAETLGRILADAVLEALADGREREGPG